MNTFNLNYNILLFVHYMQVIGFKLYINKSGLNRFMIRVNGV